MNDVPALTPLEDTQASQFSRVSGEVHESLCQPNSSDAVDLTIITGFLGSGKTTLLTNILKNQSIKKRFAIVLNEFAQTGDIESNIIKSSFRDKETGDKASEWIEMSNGCLCCTVK